MFSFPAKMMRVFKDEAMQADFERDGYVIVDFYTTEEISLLTKLYDDLHPVDEKGFFPSTFSNNKKYRQDADTEIRKIGERWMSDNLQDYKTMCGSFIVKYPSPESKMSVHQDMTLVDETKYTGMNIWCPLIDLDDTNGVLQVMKGSHRLIPSYRGSSIPGIYDNISDQLLPFLKPVYLKAGQAVVFDQSIIHYSDANNSDQKRITTNIYFTHKDATFRTAYFDKNGPEKKIELFEQDETFMTNFEQFGANIADRPKIGRSLGLVDYDFPTLDIEKLYTLYPDAKRPFAIDVIPEKIEINESPAPTKKSFFKKILETFAN